jgi:hypothetical protein
MLEEWKVVSVHTGESNLLQEDFFGTSAITPLHLTMRSCDQGELLFLSRHGSFVVWLFLSSVLLNLVGVEVGNYTKCDI